MNTTAHDEILNYFHKASIERAEFEEKVLSNVEQLRASNELKRLEAQRDLDEEYRNYIIPV